MPVPEPAPTGIYRFTSIARPVDPRYPTNRALLIALPLLALASAALAGFLEPQRDALSLALRTMLVGFAAWALTRELAPDDDAAAFVALALAWPALLFFDTAAVVLPFVALFLVRIVNRSTGVAARPLDTLGVLAFVIWAALSLEQGFILLVAAAAFSLDAMLRDPHRYHFLAAMVCLAVFAWWMTGTTPMLRGQLAGPDWLLMAALAGAVLQTAIRRGQPTSVCDVFGARLDRVRINAGLTLGLFLAIQALLVNGRPGWIETPIWACLAAVPLSPLARRVMYLRR